MSVEKLDHLRARTTLSDRLRAHARHMLAGSNREVKPTPLDEMKTQALLLEAFAVIVERMT